MHDISWAQIRRKRADLKSYIRRFLLCPYFWEDSNKSLIENLAWKKIKFTEENVKKISTKNGIYCFVVEPNYSKGKFIETHYLFYVGKAASISIRSRYKMYIDEKNGIGIGEQKPRIKVREMLNDYENHIIFYYSEINEKELIEEIENKLLNTFVPYVNTHIPEAKIKPELKDIYQ